MTHTPAEMRALAGKRWWTTADEKDARAILRQAADAMEAGKAYIEAADECVNGGVDVAAMLKFAEADQRARKVFASPAKEG